MQADTLGIDVLRRDADRLRQILQGAVEHAIVEMDLDRTIRGWSSGAERLFGWAQDEALGRVADLLFTSEDCIAGVPEREAGQALAEGRAEDTRWHRRRDGSLFWASGCVSPLRDLGGRPDGLLKIVRDHTATRQAEEALLGALAAANRASTLRAHLITVAGHDLRQPMQVIGMALESLQGKVADEKGRKHLDFARTALDRLGRELDALALKASDDAVAPDLDVFQLQDVLAGVASTWRHHARAKDLRLRVVGTRARVRCDRAMLRTILNNLVGNALKYTERGGVVVGCRRQGGGALVLTVVDSGIGIEGAMQAAIFEPRRQLDPTRDGLGLGLSIVQRTAEVLGLRLVLASVPGRGSRFGIEVPLVEEA